MKAFTFFFSFLLSFDLGAQNMDLTDTSNLQAAGMPIVLRETKTSYGEIVAFHMTARGGVTLTSQAGALDLLIESLSKGTPSHTKEDIDRILTQTGAVFAINARQDSIDLSLKCLKKYLPTLLPMISEMIRVPLLVSDEVELVRRQMTAALKSELEHPDGILALSNHKTFFKGHPYYNRTSGFLETLPAIKREDLVALLPKIFNKQNVFFTVIGNLTKEETSSMVQTHFASLPEAARAAPLSALLQNDSKLSFEKFETPTTYFMARFKSPTLPDEDYPALTMAIQILDNRLFEEVRTKRALTYSVSASLGSSLSNSGLLYVSSTQLPEAVKVIFDEVKKIQTELISTEDLASQVRKFLSSWLLSREAPSSQARVFTYYEILGLGWAESNKFIERMKMVSPEQVRAAAQKYLKDYSSTVVGPKNEKIEF